jgi:DNA-binding transcriptional MerR regulator
MDGFVTIDDILEVAPVSPRTVRYWVQKGLLPRPLRHSGGYKQGVLGLYPPEALSAAQIAFQARKCTLEERLKLIQSGETHDWYVYKGVLTLRVHQKTAFKE